jgi:biotin operon repressor
VDGLGRIRAAGVKVHQDRQKHYRIESQTELERRWPEE